MAVNFMNRVLVYSKSELFRDENRIAKYLVLIAHYELGHKDLKAVLNEYFESGESVEPLDFLKLRLPDIRSKKEEAKVFSEFRKLLVKSGNKKMLDTYFDFMSYAERKIKGRETA